MTGEGPLERIAVPPVLTGRVVDPATRAIHGYQAEEDLARHYRFIDVAFLALTGELPDEAASRALDIAMTFLAPVSVAEAPAHAAVLARVCAADLGATLAIAATALAEQARFIVDRHADWISWLEEQDTSFPDGGVIDEQERASCLRLAALLAEAGLTVPAVAKANSRMCALLAVLHACGLRNSEQMAAVLVVARMPSVVAEAFATPLASFESYPMHLPPFGRETR